MNPIPLVTIAVRFLGLVLIVLGTPTVSRTLHEVLQAFLMGHGWAFLSPFIDYGDDDPGHRLGWFLLFAAGLYMLLSGRWLIARLTRGIAWPGGKTCHRCGYDLSGVTGPVCPECGAKLVRR